MFVRYDYALADPRVLIQVPASWMKCSPGIEPGCQLQPLLLGILLALEGSLGKAGGPR